MTEVVEVRTGARLHFGLFGTRPAEGGRLGGIGMMIDRPGVVLQAALSDKDAVSGPGHATSRAAEFLGRLRTDRHSPDGGGHRQGRVALRVLAEIPPHRGFGSGTQLALAVAEGVRALHAARVPFGVEQRLGRGSRSAIGTAGFYRGGFLCDLPDPTSGAVGRISRHLVPELWRVVVIDPAGAAGPTGAAEAAGFEVLPPMPPRTTAALMTLVHDRIAPGLDGADFAAFPSAVAEFNRLVGEHFAPVQGGIYAHPLIRELAGTLVGTDWPHLAQSSWGPAAAVFCESEASAESLYSFLRGHIAQAEADIFTAAPLNHGAAITAVGPT